MFTARHTRPAAAVVAVVAWFLFGSPFSWAAEHSSHAIQAPPVDFERHLMGLFGRMGCNSGSCHGSFQGRGGFRLSLFGFDPDKDHAALTREVLGRRINPVDPEQSLLLLKASGQIEHGGGRRFAVGSWQYRLFRDWIAAGAPWRPGSGATRSIVVSPSEVHFAGKGETGQLAVQARFEDGSEEDITRFCDFRIQDDTIAEVSPLGQVKGLRPGDTAVVVSYRGHLVPVRVLVPVAAAPGFHYPKVPESNFIDREVFAKLKRLNIVPSDLSGDAEFLRRITIDTIGCLPSPEQVRAFLADPAIDKRPRKIAELLAHPLHAALWATKFCDITGNNTDVLEQPREKRSQMWHGWFRKRLAENVPYDEIVQGVLCATSRDNLAPGEWIKQVKMIDESAQKGFDTNYVLRSSLDLFWRRQQGNVPIEQWGEKTAAAFMGIRLECAQCHKHPFDRWSQADYRAYANIFGLVKFAVSADAKTVIEAENADRKKNGGGKGKPQPLPPIRELFVGGKPISLPNPDTNKPLPAKALGGPVIPIKDGQDPRRELFDWLRMPDNPYFARSFVNRVWGHYFGVGIVDPVDDFSLANPAANDQLLKALAREFVDRHYDIHHLEELILNSRVYQLAALPNPTNQLDRRNYSRGYVRRMMAEVVVDVLNSALGLDGDFGSRGGQDLPPGSRAIEVGASRVQNGNLAYIFRIFGRPPRTSACDCERALEPALPQTLFLMTDQNLLNRMQAPNGRLRQLLDGNRTDEEILDELFLATLTRHPTAAEKELFDGIRSARGIAGSTAAEPARKDKARPGQKNNQRIALFVDTLWALINTREFILNH